jgi:hypothetical protein
MNKIIDQKYVISNDDRKYVKFLVTIALRLGIEVKEPEDIVLRFNGRFSEYNDKKFKVMGVTKSHDSYNYVGSLSVNGKTFDTTEVKICTPRVNQSEINTLWPIFKDNYRSQLKNHTRTRDFITEYGSDQINLTIEDLAKYYHPLFLNNPERTPVSMALEVSELKAHTRRKMHKAEKAKLQEKAKKAEEKAQKAAIQISIAKEKTKEAEDKVNDYQHKLNKVIKENKDRKGSPNQETIKTNPDVDWSSSAVTSAVFNSYKEIGDYLCIYINNQTKPIRLKNTSWKSKYPAAIENVKKLKKGDIFKYITQGVNTFSTDEWFNRIIIDVENSIKSENKNKATNVHLHGSEYLLSHENADDLKNTKYTFKTTFNVINTYQIPGNEFRKHFGFEWKRPMIMIETDLGWYIDSTLNSEGGTKWVEGEHHNCSISLTNGKYLPYWLEK